MCSRVVTGLADFITNFTPSSVYKRTRKKIKKIKQVNNIEGLRKPYLAGAYQCPKDIHVVLSRVHGFHLIRYLVEVEHEEAAGRLRADVAAEKTSLLHQLVDAVAHVHSRGVVYRDLKPANVMVKRPCFSPSLLPIFPFSLHSLLCFYSFPFCCMFGMSSLACSFYCVCRLFSPAPVLLYVSSSSRLTLLKRDLDSSPRATDDDSSRGCPGPGPVH